jgi:hypothetical protein
VLVAAKPRAPITRRIFMLSRTSSHGSRDETQLSALTSPQRRVLPSGSVELAAALCHGSNVVAKLWSFLRDRSIRLRLTIPRRTSFGNLMQHGYACRTICLDTRSIRNGGRSFPKIEHSNLINLSALRILDGSYGDRLCLGGNATKKRGQTSVCTSLPTRQRRV